MTSCGEPPPAVPPGRSSSAHPSRRRAAPGSPASASLSASAPSSGRLSSVASTFQAFFSRTRKIDEPRPPGANGSRTRSRSIPGPSPSRTISSRPSAMSRIAAGGAPSRPAPRRMPLRSSWADGGGAWIARLLAARRHQLLDRRGRVRLDDQRREEPPDELRRLVPLRHQLLPPLRRAEQVGLRAELGGVGRATGGERRQGARLGVAAQVQQLAGGALERRAPGVRGEPARLGLGRAHPLGRGDGGDEQRVASLTLVELPRHLGRVGEAAGGEERAPRTPRRSGAPPAPRGWSATRPAPPPAPAASRPATRRRPTARRPASPARPPRVLRVELARLAEGGDRAGAVEARRAEAPDLVVLERRAPARASPTPARAPARWRAWPRRSPRGEARAGSRRWRGAAGATASFGWRAASRSISASASVTRPCASSAAPIRSNVTRGSAPRMMARTSRARPSASFAREPPRRPSRSGRRR